MKTLMRIGAAVAATALAMSTAPAVSAHETWADHSHQKPSWQQFESETFRDTDGQYIVDGDIPVPNTGSLFKFYDSLPSGPVAPESGGTGDLIANTDVYGNATLWPASQAKNLTYCVSNNFGSRKATVVNAMQRGAAMWENSSSGIDFRYVSSQDGNCNTRNNYVVFSVEPTSSTGYIARAFFPNSPKSSRNVLVADQFYSSGWQQEAIMAHELGHTLGFRHEHTRPEAGTCFEDNNWTPLTPYDSVSIMHYPQCNGGSANLSFSPYDRSGVQRAYGS
ncbi:MULTISPECIES: M57 family metalloprotease [Kocuria]|uniref:Matrixin family metalloprotease n=1 Tax=Kocuria subflava TaxID=1736139 RepID=A0A846TKI9_9MICC|nr:MULTISPECIES: M57 family metalloprotease [Kocuria]NKE08973.1 matrixin family metalloprotease [Kocuria subflava]